LRIFFLIRLMDLNRNCSNRLNGLEKNPQIRVNQTFKAKNQIFSQHFLHG
jgi:hypothetical protein